MAGAKAKTDFVDQSAEARKKRMEMPADEYGKMVDRTMGKSEGRAKGDFNEEPDTAPKKKYAAGGKVMNENTLMKKEGRNMAKAAMEKVASKAVKGHEKRMHGMKAGGSVSSASKRADGCATKGKTRGKVL